MDIYEFDLLYDEIFLEKITLNIHYTKKEFIDLLYKSNIFFDINLNIINIGQNEKYQLNIREEYALEIFLSILNIQLNEKSLKIIKYLNILNDLCESPNNFLDDYFLKKGKVSLVNYVEIISERNYMISKNLLINFLNKKNVLLCYYFTRDLVENLKLYIYFLTTSIEDNKKEKNIIHYNLENEGNNWEYDIKKIIKKYPSLNFWKKDFNLIKNINDDCNNYIHKNGFTKISPRLININNSTDFLGNWYIIIKFFFTIVTILDCKSISSSDNLDFIENSASLSNKFQNAIAPAFQKFIDSEYTNEEKMELKKECYMYIE